MLDGPQIDVEGDQKSHSSGKNLSYKANEKVDFQK
jgi:hypothetical protein